MSNQRGGRGPASLTQGTKIALTLAVCSLAVAVYYYTTATHFVGHDGSIFGCGSPMEPNTSELAKHQCGILENVSLHKALLFLALGLILAIFGFGLFRAPRTDRFSPTDGADAVAARPSARRSDDPHNQDRRSSVDAPGVTPDTEGPTGAHVASDAGPADRSDSGHEPPTRQRLSRFHGSS